MKKVFNTIGHNIFMFLIQCAKYLHWYNDIRIGHSVFMFYISFFMNYTKFFITGIIIGFILARIICQIIYIFTH